MKFEDLIKANKEIKTTNIKGKDYAEVNQRIKVFRMLFPEGCISTEVLKLDSEMCVMKASAFDSSGKLLGVGTAFEMKNDKTSFVNKTSYIENCETSAVGRALGMLGIGIDTSVASYEEVSNAIEQQEYIAEQEKIANSIIDKVKVKALEEKCKADNVDVNDILKLYKVNSLAELTEVKYANIIQHWDKVKGEK